MKQTTLALKYALFAAFSTGINLAVQRGTGFIASGSFALYIQMFFGTIAGLIAKYLLDKHYIFYYTPPSRKEEALKFFLYTGFSVFTTLVFWGTELAFHSLFSFKGAEYAGAAVGLCLGYFIKYQLDKRFVFRGKTESQTQPETETND